MWREFLLDKKELASILIRLYQDHFPVVHNPYQVMGEETGADPNEIQSTLRALSAEGKISRIGPVFATHKVGRSFLAAVKCPVERIEEVAGIINSFEEVNHNYLRENEMNLWFVMTGPDELHLDHKVRMLEEKIKLAVFRFPMIKPFKIDLTLKGDFKW